MKAKQLRELNKSLHLKDSVLEDDELPRYLEEKRFEIKEELRRRRVRQEKSDD
jgi:hypothetical protein